MHKKMPKTKALFLKRRAIILSIVFILSNHLNATESTTVVDTLKQVDRKGSEQINSFARFVDRYLAGRSYSDEKNQSELKLHNDVLAKEGGEVKYSFHASGKLHLPHIEKKLRLNFTSFDPDAQDRGINRSRLKNPKEGKGLTTNAVIMREFMNFDTTFRPQIQFGRNIETSYVFIFDNKLEAQEWSLNPEFHLFGRTDSGTGIFTGSNLSFALEKFSGSFIFEAQYSDGDNTTRFNNGFSLDYKWSSFVDWSTRLLIESDNRKVLHSERITYSIEFLSRAIEKFVELSILPAVVYEKAEAFYPRYQVTTSIRLVF